MQQQDAQRLAGRVTRNDHAPEQEPFPVTGSIAQTTLGLEDAGLSLHMRSNRCIEHAEVFRLCQTPPGRNGVFKRVVGVAQQRLPLTSRLDSTALQIPVGKSIGRQFGLHLMQPRILGEQAVCAFKKAANTHDQRRMLNRRIIQQMPQHGLPVAAENFAELAGKQLGFHRFSTCSNQAGRFNADREHPACQTPRCSCQPGNALLADYPGHKACDYPPCD